MNRRHFLHQLTATAGLLRAQQPPNERPNFIVILADDLGYGDLGSYGSPYIRTPNLDRMAREGARLTDFYGQPMCGPSRAALLTGCYPVRNGLMFNHLPRARTGIHPGEITLPELLKTRGYSTAIVGKWHLGDAPEFLPTRHGFDSWFGLPYSNDMWPFHPKVRTGAVEHPRLTAARRRAEFTGYDGQGQTYPGNWFPNLPLMSGEDVIEHNPDQTKLTGAYTAKAIEFIQKNRSKPFFLYLAHSMPHVPLFAGQGFEGRSLRGRYGDVVEELDASVGRILETLKTSNLVDRTVVLFTSDNGPWQPYGIDAGSAGPLRGGKGSTWEGGMRVPTIAWAPGRIPAGLVSSEVAANIDLLPTFARLAGAALPEHKIDGRDIWPLMTERGARSPHEAFYYFAGAIQYRAEDGRPVNQAHIKAVRRDNWKLHVDSSENVVRATELYDLHGDVSESRNVRERHPEVARTLEALARSFEQGLHGATRPLGTLDASE